MPIVYCDLRDFCNYLDIIKLISPVLESIIQLESPAQSTSIYTPDFRNMCMAAFSVGIASGNGNRTGSI